MTVQQGIEDILASLAHNLRQLERDARNWEHQANDWKAIADRQRDELNAAYAAHRMAEARVSELSRQLAEAQAELRTQAEREQEIAELRASASLAIDRWKRSEAIRGAAVTDLTIANDERDEAREYAASLRSALEDLLTGAEQQSQSHVDVAAKCRAALRAAGEGV